MKNNRNKKIFLLLSTYLVFLFVPKTKNDSKEITYNESYVYESITPYATYSNGNVYIIDDKTFEQLDINENDIYVIDNRELKDSDMAIYESYRIKSNKEMIEILEILLDYENNYPSNWNRTIESMRNEWNIHNICYSLGINRSSTEKVNFNNNDQEKYDSKILSFFLNN